MSEESKNAIDALTGGNGDVSQVDWEKRYHELEQKMNGVRVEEGRVKKLDEELKARDKRIAELEAESRKSDLRTSVSEDERSAVPDEVQTYTEKLVGAATDRVRKDYERRINEIEERNRADRAASASNARNAFIAKINARFPKFIWSVTNGGDKVEQWNSYQVHNAATINGAIANNDFDTLAYHIEQFYNYHLGIPVPSGDESGSAAPDPRSHGGGSQVTPASKKYTQEEINDLYDKESVLHQRYLETLNSVDKDAWLSAKKEIAVAEGRASNA